MMLKCNGISYRWSLNRFLLNFMITALFITFTLIFITNVAGGTMAKKATQFTVKRGDTLWSIAHSFAPGKDPRKTINNIKSRNNLESSNLRVGQKLLLDI